MIAVMISVTRCTMSAFSICAVPNERTIAAVTSGNSRSDRFAPRSTETTRAAGVSSRGRVHLEVGAEVGLLFGHRLEQQPLLRREVAVHGAERDVGRGGDVAHLHRVEAPLRRELQRRVEHPAPAGGLAARQGPFGRRLGLGLGGDHRGIGTRSDFHGNNRRWDAPRHGAPRPRRQAVHR